MEAMAKMPDKAFELAIVDPPYGIGWDGENTTMSAGMRKNGTQRKMKSWNNPVPKEYVKKEWDNNTPNKIYFDELRRVSRKQIIWGGNYFTLPPARCFIVWDKCISEDFSLAMGELAWTSFDKLAKIIQIPTPKNGDKIHPTQKPVKLYKWLLKNYAKPEYKIIDTHLGSGSSAIAAYDFGINEFVGCEIDTEYFEAAKHRFEIHKMQQVLF